MTDSLQAAVAAGVQLARNGSEEEAFFLLHELGVQIAPLLLSEYRTAPEASVRLILLEVAKQLRTAECVSLMAAALSDPESAVWQEAIAGLVTIGSPAGIEILRQALCGPPLAGLAHDEHVSWLTEAIDQIEEACSV